VALIGLDAVDLGGWLSLVVLVAVAAGVAGWLARIVWKVANWGETGRSGTGRQRASKGLRRRGLALATLID
jgi:hypothetical protein